jgi:hypothetical protein
MPSDISVGVEHAVPSPSRVSKIEGAWKELRRALRSGERPWVCITWPSERRVDVADIPVNTGPVFWHEVEAGGFRYGWNRGKDVGRLSDEWLKLWKQLGGGREVDNLMERHQWDPLGLSLYVAPLEVSKLSRWYVKRLLPKLEELCG